MITLLIVLILFGALFMAVLAGAAVLLDPIIAIAILVLVFKLVKKIFRKKKG